MKKSGLRFILLFGSISLFADMAYEGMRSIIGPFFAHLGASGAIVGTVAGLGELFGYSLRPLSGYLADKSRSHWVFAALGYFVNLFAIPFLALANTWQAAASLFVAERVGKGIRSPSTSTLISFAAHQTGRGTGFAIHEALDQTGALLGPLLMMAVLFFTGNFHLAFALLVIPAVIAFILLGITRLKFPNPEKMEKRTAHLETKGFDRSYWIYLLAVGLVGAGYSDFALISFHFAKSDIMPTIWVPVMYGIAMAVDGLSSLGMGKLFDRFGTPILATTVFFAAFASAFVFLGGFYLSLVGMILWGIGLGAQESIMRAHLADLAPPEKRGSAFGMFYLSFGIFWFAGSALKGHLYDISIISLVAFSILAQLAAIPLFILSRPSNQ